MLMNIALRCRHVWFSCTNSWHFAIGIVVPDPLLIPSQNTPQKTIPFLAGKQCWDGPKWHFQSTHMIAIFSPFWMRTFSKTRNVSSRAKDVVPTIKASNNSQWQSNCGHNICNFFLGKVLERGDIKQRICKFLFSFIVIIMVYLCGFKLMRLLKRLHLIRSPTTYFKNKFRPVL